MGSIRGARITPPDTDITPSTEEVLYAQRVVRLAGALANLVAWISPEAAVGILEYNLQHYNDLEPIIVHLLPYVWQDIQRHYSDQKLVLETYQTTEPPPQSLIDDVLHVYELTHG